MEDQLDQFIDKFYTKYAPNNLPQGETRASLKQKLSSDFEGYVTKMYQKHGKGTIPDSAQMATLRSKYYTQPVVSEQQGVPEQPQEQQSGLPSLGQIFDDTYGTTLKPLYELGKSAVKTIYSGLTDTVPQSVEQAGEVVESAINPTNIDEFIRTKKPADFQRFVREKEGLPWYKPFGEEGYKNYLPKYGKEYMETHGFGEDVTRMEKNLPAVTERRKNLEEYVSQQKSEAQAKTEGVVQDFRDIKDPKDFASYIGSMIGQAAYQVPVSVASRGASSYILEAATIYDKQIDRLAEENGITREQVIEQNLDKPAMGQAYGIAAAALDAVSAGNLIGSFRKAGGSLLKKYLEKAVPEGVTEAAQGVLEDVGSGGTVQDAITGEGLASRINELAGGMVGGTVFSMVGKEAQKNEANEMINDAGDTGNPSINSAIDADAALTPAQEELLKTKQAEEQLEEVTEVEDKLIKEKEKEDAKSLRENEGQVPEAGTSSETSQNESSENLQQPESQDTGDSQNEVTTFDQTPEYKAADEKIRAIAEEVRVNPTAENAKSLNEAIQERDNARIAFEQKPSRKLREAKSVKMTPSEALKAQVQNFYRGVEEGVRKGQKMTNEQLVTKVQEAIKDSPLQPSQINSILTKVRKTNLFTAGSISKLNSYIDKVSNDAVYAEKLEQADALQKKVRKQSKNKGNIPQNIKSAAKAFASIDPYNIEDVDEYQTLGQSIVDSFKNPTKPDYSAVNTASINKYVKDYQQKQEQEQFDRLREQFGFAPDEVSDDDLRKLLESDPEKQDEFLNNKDEGRKVIVRDKLLRTAQYAKLGIQGIDKSQFDSSDAKIAENLANAPIGQLGDGQLVDYVRSVDNILENGDFSNASNVAAQTEAIQALNELNKMIDIEKLGVIGKFKAALYNLPVLFSAIYSDSKLASKVQQLSGIEDVFNGGSRVEGAEKQLYLDFRDKIGELRKRYGKDVKDASTMIRVGAFAALVRYKKGSDPIKALEKSKYNIRESIARLGQIKENNELVKDYQAAYDLFKDSETIDDILAKMKQSDPAGYEMWKFFKDKYDSDVRSKLKATNEQIYNEDFEEFENYTPISLSKVDPTMGDALDVNDQTRSSKNVNRPKQATTSMKASGNLRRTDALNLKFYETMFNKYRESRYSIETAKARLKVREFMRLPGTAKILGGVENKNKIVNNYLKSEEVQRGFGKEYTDAARFLDEVTSTLRTLGYTSALGSFDQFFKQYIPVAFNTMINLGGDANLFWKTRIPEGAEKLLGMYTIGQRGNRQGGVERGEATRYKIQAAYRSKLLKSVNKIHMLSEKGSSIFMYSLSKGDVSVAQRSWVAYYMKFLKDAGIDLNTVDLATEHLKQSEKVRRDAASYAEQKVKETQVVSNAAELANILRTASGAESWIKNIFLPFSTFSFNTKVRIIENFRQLKTSEDKPAAYRALGGTVTEIAMYSFIKYAILSQVYNLIKSGIEEGFDLEPDDKDDSEGLLRKFYTAVYKDFMPFAIGSIGENASINLANGLAYLSQNPDMTYDEWKKDTHGGTFYKYESKDGFMDLGLYSISLKRIQDLVTDVNTTLTGTAKLSTQWGQDKEVTLDPDQEKFVAFMTMLDFMSAAGLMDATLYNQSRRVFNEQMNKKEGSEKTEAPRPQPRVQPRPRPRILPRPIPR